MKPLARMSCLALLLGSAVAWPSRADEQVNTYTTNDQRTPSVAMDADGDFVVVWTSYGSAGSDSSGSSIQRQRYASDGSTVGSELQVNTYTTSGQTDPAVAMGVGGDFVVAWGSGGSFGTDTSFGSIQGQRYASDGSEVGGQFQINTYTTDRQFRPSVAVGAGGDFVVVWFGRASSGSDSDGYSVHGQRYSSDGSAAGGEFQVNTYTTSHQSGPSVAVAADGDFVVVWDSFGSSGSDSSSWSVRGQRYASDGSAVGGEFQVNTYTTSAQFFSSVGGEADGDFVVVWTSYGSSGSDSSSGSIQGQRYASDGSAVGGELQINTYTTNGQRDPAVVVDAGGDFVVVWRSNGSSGSDSDSWSIHGQRYASDGSAVGGEFQVNTFTTSFQQYPSVAADALGDFVVVWESNGSAGSDTSSYSVQKSDPGLVPVELISFTIE